MKPSLLAKILTVLWTMIVAIMVYGTGSAIVEYCIALGWPTWSYFLWSAIVGILLAAGWVKSVQLIHKLGRADRS